MKNDSESRENGLKKATVFLAQEAASCGFPSPAEPYMDRPLDLHRLLVAHPAATFFVRAGGDSMVGAGIYPGDILVVDRSLEPSEGDVVVACIDGEFTVKHLRKRGGLRLEPANPKYPALRFKGEEELRIFGVVSSSLRLFRKPLLHDKEEEEG